MINYLKNLFSLSDNGAKDLYKASISCCITNIALMASVSILYIFLKDTVMPVIEGSMLVLNLPIYLAYSIAIFIIVYICNFIQYNSTFLASYSESATKRITLAEKLRKLPLSYFGNKDLSDLTTTIMADTESLETAFSHYIPQLFGAIVSTCIVSISMLFINFKMGISLIWVVPISFLLLIATKKIQDRANIKNKKIQLIYIDGIQECIDNVKDIKSNNQIDKHMDIMEKKLTAYEKYSIKSELTSGILVTSAQMILKLGITTSVIIGVTLLLRRDVDIFMFIVFMMVATRIFDPLSGALINLAGIYNSLLRVNRMNEIEKYPIQEGAISNNYNGWDVNFDNVKFSYNQGANVLNGISFTAKQGEITALVGASGCGKSTIAKLAPRFWDIDSGKITLGGVDISKVEPETLMKNYSIVFQDVLLFNNTIIENIRIGKKDASDEEIYEVAKAARCDEFINKMPDGYQTIIGENGCILSGGERQRISIARALLKDAPVVLLDEATASLDIENESLIQDAISKLIKNKTVIVIAHRMRTISQADKIIVLDEGKISEIGTHKELSKNNGIYSRMVELQLKSSNWILE
ncbi:ABC transporter ATP-binding protein [Clostridioides difficile]|nr:ABC transporter ATP-binding protein [Clostridioides difficile]